MGGDGSGRLAVRRAATIARSAASSSHTIARVGKQRKNPGPTGHRAEFLEERIIARAGDHVKSKPPGVRATEVTHAGGSQMHEPRE